MDTALLVVALGAAVAGFVQGLSGFAFGMVAMSFWAWVLPPKVAAILVVFGSLLGQILAAFSVRRGLNLRWLLPLVLGGLAGIPVGVLLLPRIDMDLFKVLLGSLLVVWCPAMLFSQKLPRVPAGHPAANGVVGFVGGLMGGLGGFTGVIPTLWCTLCRCAKDTQRSIIQNFNLSMLTVTMATYAATGMVGKDVLPLLAIVAPAMLVPTYLGARMYIGMSDVRFRQIVLALLTLSGIALLAGSLPAFLTERLR